MWINLKGTLFSLMAVGMTIGMMGAVYAKTDSPVQPNCSQNLGNHLDLQIKDQNESWRDNVTGTWVANNMAPGNNYTFDGAFVGLKSNVQGGIGITCDYTVKAKSSSLPTKTSIFFSQSPDRMAKQLIVTNALYKNSSWQINLLTGNPSGMSSKDQRSYTNGQSYLWKMQDTDRDGLITFYDLKQKSLSNLPLPASTTESARYLMSVMFAKTAGNDLEGAIFNFTMFYTFDSLGKDDRDNGKNR
jgi:hypothetical protein